MNEPSEQSQSEQPCSQCKQFKHDWCYSCKKIIDTSEFPIQLVMMGDQLVVLTNWNRIMVRTEELEPYKEYWREIKFNSN